MPGQDPEEAEAGAAGAPGGDQGVPHDDEIDELEDADLDEEMGQGRGEAKEGSARPEKRYKAAVLDSEEDE